METIFSYQVGPWMACEIVDIMIRQSVRCVMVMFCCVCNCSYCWYNERIIINHRSLYEVVR